MTDIEISKALALAIGYLPEHVRVVDWGNGGFVGSFITVMHGRIWRTFDYRQPHTIFQIAERYNCFPSHEFSFLRNELYWKACKGGYVATADTAAEAIALAVIRGAK